MFRWCYLNSVQTDSPPGPQQKELMETTMTFSMIDRFAPVLLLALGVFSAVATAGVGIA
jgi:hypothetical protein